MDDIQQTNQNSTVPSSTPPVNPPVSASPWDDAVPEEAPKTPVVVGTLEDETHEKAAVPAAPFSVPQNIETETKPAVIPAGELAPAAAIEPSLQPEASPMPVQSLATPVPEDSVLPTTPAPIPAPLTPAVPSIEPASADLIPETAPVDTVAEAATEGLPTLEKTEGLADSKSIDALVAEAKGGETLPPVTPIAPVLDPLSQIAPAVAPSEISPLPEPAAEALPEDDLTALTPPAPIKTPPIAKGLLKILLITIPLLIVAVAASLYYLTEAGMISIGFENVYSAVGLGGLSKDGEKAIGQSFLAMKKQTGFGVAGTMTLNLNSGVKSDIVTPIISMSQTTIYANVQRAVLAVTTASDKTLDSSDSGIWGSLDTTPATDPVTDSTALDAAASTSATTDSTTDSTGSTSLFGSDSTATDSETTAATTVADQIIADLTANVGSDGEEISFDFGNAKTASVRRIGAKLYVLSSGVKFKTGQDADKWLQYDTPALAGKSLIEELFNVDGKSGFSAKGLRQSNVKVGTIRAYKYHFDSIEIGDLAELVGVSSDMVQSISGDVWIGIKDHLVRKISLKITVAPSFAVSSIKVDLDFSSYGSVSSVDTPDAALIQDESTLSTASTAAATTDTTSDTTAAEATTPAAPTIDPAVVRDTQRKADLASIKTALIAYKAAIGRYPTAKTITHLNTSGNVVERALVTGYIAALPTDPNTATTWWYGYKSTAGSTFTLSTQLETATDPELQVVGGVSLYIVSGT